MRRACRLSLSDLEAVSRFLDACIQDIQDGLIMLWDDGENTTQVTLRTFKARNAEVDEQIERINDMLICIGLETGE